MLGLTYSLILNMEEICSFEITLHWNTQSYISKDRTLYIYITLSGLWGNVEETSYTETLIWWDWNKILAFSGKKCDFMPLARNLSQWYNETLHQVWSSYVPSSSRFGYHIKYEGYAESNLHSFYATNVGARKSLRMRGSITWLLALYTIM
jgi:hypothetical protein